MHVAGEHGLDLVPGDQFQEPGPAGLLVIVVMGRLVRRVDVGRIVGEDEDPLGHVLRQVSLQPVALPRLRVAAQIDQRGIHHHEMTRAPVEGVVVGPEEALVERDRLCRDRARRRADEGLVADVVVAGHVTQVGRERLENVERLGAGRLVGRQVRQGVHHVAQVHGEIARVLGDGVCRKARPVIGAIVDRERRGLVAARRANMRVGDDRKCEQGRAGGFARHHSKSSSFTGFSLPRARASPAPSGAATSSGRR